MKSLAAAALLALSALGASSLQDAPSGPTGTPEHKWLRQLVGEWEVASECWTGPSTPPMKFESVEKARAIGELWVLAESNGKVAGIPFTSLLTLGYDPAKKCYVGSWVDTMQTHHWVFRGALDEAQKLLTLETEGPYFEDTTKTVPFRNSFELVSPDHKIFRSSVKQPDGTWLNFLTAHYRRKR
ncbi:MAG: DUF1579 domain-containing protein [Planctomycetes bacterium]|nr:DUF1579 domain-containing protein [Planctomycetota bacterium]